MGSGNSSETPKKARVPDEDEEVLNLSEDEVFGPKVVRLFNFIEDIRGSKDNSISWTELEDFFKRIKGMGLSEAVRNRKQTMKLFDANEDNRISLHEFRTYIDKCAHQDWSATRLQIQTELNVFEEKLKKHEKDRRNAMRQHADKPGLIASIELCDEATVTDEDILDTHLFYTNLSTAPRCGGVPPRRRDAQRCFQLDPQRIVVREAHGNLDEGA